MKKPRIIKHFKIELKWAIIFTIMSLVWVLLEKTLGWHTEKGIADQWWLTLFFFPFAIIMYWLAMRETRRRIYKKVISWTECFLSGLLMAFFVALLTPLAQYITHDFITPEYFETVKNYSVTNDFLKIEEANEYFNINNYRWKAAIGAFLGGTVVAAIGAIFLRTSHKQASKVTQ
jgi:Mn2+/Fe2+ NRAMP family transporter